MVSRKAQWMEDLTEALLNSGWYCVYNRESGVYWKKGNVLVVGTEINDSKIECFCLPKVVRSIAVEMINQKKTNWFIERNGVVIAYGNLSKSKIVGLKDVGISVFDKYVELSDTESFSQALIKTKTQVTEMHDAFVRTDKSITETRLVRSTENGKVFLIIGSNETDVALSEVRICRGVTDSLEHSSELITCTKEEFNTKRISGALEVVEIMNQMIRVEKPVLGRVVTSPVADVPEEFKVFGLSNKQLLMLGVGIADCTNITPILNPRNNVNGDGIELFKNALLDLGWVCNAGLSADVFTKMYQAHCRGFDVSKLNATYLTPEAIDFMVNEELEEYGDTDRWGMLLYSLGGTGNSVMDLMEFYANRFKLGSVVHTMRLYGIQKEDSISLSWKQVVDKSAVYSFFAWSGVMLGDGVCWDNVLERLMDNGDYLIFSPTTGFVLQTYAGGFGRDMNGLVRYDQSLKPVWRMIYLNEKTYCYGDSSWLSNFSNTHF